MLKETSAGFSGWRGGWEAVRQKTTVTDEKSLVFVSPALPHHSSLLPLPSFSLFLFALSCILIIAAALCCWFDLSSALHCASFSPFPYFASLSNFFLLFSAQLSMGNIKLPVIHLCSPWCWLECHALGFPIFFLPFPSTPSEPTPALVLRIHTDVWLSSQRVA